MQKLKPLLTITSASSDWPVTIGMAKEQLGIYHEDLDTIIEVNLLAATEHIESLTGRTYRATLAITESYPEIPYGCIGFTINPVKSIASIEYYPVGSGTLTAIPTTDYRLAQSTNGGATLEWDDNAVLPDTDSRVDAVQVKYVAGYDTDDVPNKAKAAILLQLELLYGDLDARERPSVVNSIGSLVRDLRWVQYQ